MSEIEIEIDGRKITAKPNQMVIQAADEAGIYIPRFCYHKHLSVAANCRMCLVEVEKSPKTLPACATPVMPGMKVYTRSPKTLEAQRAVMEFLLINHPLDCPICDQGGECELQDLSMGYGASQSEYTECKRSVQDQDLGPLIATEMTRCIQCTRCVRFGDEIAGLRELGAISRGEYMEISTYVQHAIQSEVSGNIIDLCPVGALTSKPYRFTARAWELQQAPGISPHDCLGSNLNIHRLNGKVMRVVARENHRINETWLSDRDRFGYTGLYHPDRLSVPRARIDGEWKIVDWQQALDRVSRGIQETIAKHGADKLGVLASPNATLEEFYLLQKMARGLGTPHIDHRLRETDTRDQAGMPVFPGLNMPVSELQNRGAILLIGSNLRKEQPLAALRVRKAAQQGASVMVINPVDYTFNFNVAAKVITAPQQMKSALQTLVKALKANDTQHPLASILRGKQNGCVLLGALAQHHPEAAAIRALAKEIADLTDSVFGLLTEGANAAGAWIAGAVPHRHANGSAINEVGLNADEMLHKPRKGYLLLNVEPDRDCANAARAVEAMKQAAFVVALSLYRNPVLEAHADVILPIAAFTETAGTYVNAAGEWQSFHGVATPFQQSRPAWKILRTLGHFLHFSGFEYDSAEQVRDEVRALFDRRSAEPGQYQSVSLPEVSSSAALMRVGEVPVYAGDSLVRRAQPLQKTQTIMEGEVSELRLHPDTAKQYDLSNGSAVRVRQEQAAAVLTLRIDPRVAPDAVWIAGGIEATETLGNLFGPVELEKA